MQQKFLKIKVCCVKTAVVVRYNNDVSCSLSRHKRLKHGPQPYKREVSQSKTGAEPTTMVFVPMMVPNSFLTTPNLIISQPVENPYLVPEVDLSTEANCEQAFDQVIFNMDLQQIENEMKKLEGFERANTNKALLQKYFELALLNLEKDESSEKRRQDEIFKQIVSKYFIEQNEFI